MIYRSAFATGQHLAAARVMAGLKQTELAELAGLHVNSLKRLERMTAIDGNRHSTAKLAAALKTMGIMVQREPRPAIRQENFRSLA